MVVEYEVVGSGLEVVVLLPALGADRSMWASQIAAFAPDYTLLVCETGGNLQTATPDADLEDRADAVRSAMDALALECAHVVGVSMGGMLAQLLAAAWPDRVRSLALVSTTCAYDDQRRREMRERAESVRRSGMEAIAGATTERWLSPEFRAADPPASSRVRDMLLRADPRAYAGAADAVSRVDTESVLNRIGAPVLVVAGSQDMSLPPDATERLVSGLPDVEVETIPGGAHLLTVDSAARFNQVVGRFLAEHRSDDPELDRLTPSRVW